MSGVARKKLFYPLTILLEKSELINSIISFFYTRYKIFRILHNMYLNFSVGLPRQKAKHPFLGSTQEEVYVKVTAGSLIPTTCHP